MRKKLIPVALMLLVLSGCSTNNESPLTDATTTGSEKSASTVPVRVIEISAKKFEFSPQAIKVKQGERIQLKVDNTDTTHNIIVPKFRVKGEEVEFEATEKGTFEFRCANFCGAGHPGMKGTIIVE